MKTTILFIILAAVLLPAQKKSNNQKPPVPQKRDVENAAILNLRKLAIAESSYAMSHPQEGFACDARVLTRLEWPNSPTHARLVESALLTGTGRYKFSAQCASSDKPARMLHIFAVPLDLSAGLRTFCASGTFTAYPEEKPNIRTSEFPIRNTLAGDAGTCLAGGELLK